MLQNAAAFLFGLGFLISMLGWGWMLSRALRFSVTPAFGLLAAWGLGTLIAVGGCMEVLSIISPLALRGFIALGFLLGCVCIGIEWRCGSTGSVASPRRRFEFFTPGFKLLLLFTLLVLARYASFVHSDKFNPIDDYQGYFVFPAKMLQTGCMGPDPFCERRIVSSLGGEPFLDAVLLSFFSEEKLFIIEPGIAFLLSFALILHEIRRRRFELPFRFALLLPIVFMVPPVVNITALANGVVFFLALWSTWNWALTHGISLIQKVVLLAIMASACCALKSSLIPPAALLLASACLLIPCRKDGQTAPAISLLLAGTLTILLILPWMISMHRSSGTFLYPLLGKGFHGSRYGHILSPSADFSILKGIQWLLLAVVKPHVLALIVMAAVLFRSLPIYQCLRIPAFYLFASSSIALAVLAIAIGGYGVERFSFPFIFAALLALLVEAWHIQEILNNAEETRSISIRNAGITAILSIGWLMGLNWNDIKQDTKRAIANLTQPGAHCVRLPDDVDRYRRMQAAVAPHETLLARLEKPFLLDFKRNTVLIVDHPGGQSPPPGMPYLAGEDALASYLLSQSIRYVAYSYANECGFQRANPEYAERLLSGVNPWLRSGAEHTFDFQANLSRLQKHKKILYDDGDVVVLDLAEKQ